MGVGLAEIRKFEKQLENYSFLGWLNYFLKLRSDTRSNLKNNDDKVNSSSDEKDEKDECPRFLMMIQVECQAHSQIHQSDLSKER